MAKLPVEAFSFYLSLGHSRSYEAVARHFSCNKKSVTKRALKEGWQEKLREVERKTQEKCEEKAVAHTISMRERHLKMIRTMQVKGLESLKQPIASSAVGIRALDLHGANHFQMSR